MSITPPFGQSDTIATIAQRLRADSVSSSELVKDALDHAEAMRRNGSHALTRIWREEALAAAHVEDRMRSRRIAAASLLAGIPIVVKDNCDVRGDITQAGSASLSSAPPATRDADCVAELKASGAIIIGKSNMSEFACANTGINMAFGTPTSPPHQPRLVGGSSSGAAAAVAEGSVLAALGSDTGGSIRGPAALCGLVGFKPSEGRISTRGVLPLSTTFDTVGPIGRSVECCGIIDAALAARPWVPLPEYPLQGISLGIPLDLVLEDLDAPVGSAFEDALRVLREAGATITEFSWSELRHRDWRNAYSTIVRSEMYANHGRFAEANAGCIEEKPLDIILSGKAVSPQDRKDALSFRKSVSVEAHDIISRFHAVVMPTVPIVAPLVSSLSETEQAKKVEHMIGRNNEPANFFDCCAATVPCQAKGELPVGFLMMSKNGEDRRILSIASAVERVFRTRGLGYPASC